MYVSPEAFTGHAAWLKQRMKNFLCHYAWAIYDIYLGKVRFSWSHIFKKMFNFLHHGLHKFKVKVLPVLK
jgi:hypothetical protein